ncbi:MAG: hypothetical protein AAF824_04015 [Bacteroidota bacterium]
MEERWITIGSYVDIRDANAEAETLKASGISCKLIFYDHDSVLFIKPKPEDWIFMEILEGDFEEASILLDLEPYTVEDFETSSSFTADYQNEKEQVEQEREKLHWYWGLFLAIPIIIRLIIG